jgi:hypothetical protein
MVRQANAVALQHLLADNVSDGCDDRCHLVSIYASTSGRDWCLALISSTVIVPWGYYVSLTANLARLG